MKAVILSGGFGTRIKKIGFSENDVNGILGNNWYNFYRDLL